MIIWSIDDIYSTHYITMAAYEVQGKEEDGEAVVPTLHSIQLNRKTD